MKKLIFLLLGGLAIACGTSKTDNSKRPLYEVLTQQNNGGASIRFFEILTESNEIKMLQSDENLRKKIKPEDINTSNFIILNMGEKNSGGYSITVDNVQEPADKIIVTVKENQPKSGQMTTSVMSNPYTVVRINSKKEIVIK